MTTQLKIAIQISINNFGFLSGQNQSIILLSIKNSIKDSVLAANPDLNTTKVDSEHHGIGINNVRLLVNHYQGLIKFEEDEGYFIVKILIPNNPAS